MSDQPSPSPISNAELLRQLDLRRYAAEPSFLIHDGTRSLFPHHFTLPSASWHFETLRWLCGVEQSSGNGNPRVVESEAEAPQSLPVGNSLPDPQKFSEKKSTSPFHRSSQTLTAPARLLALAAPRAHAKSTLGSFLSPMWHMLEDRKHFILLISNTFAQASKFLQRIRYEWETNTQLKQFVPTVRPNRDKWSDSEIELFRDGKLCHKILALGSGHQLRGLSFLHWRPDLIVIDDGEDDEMVRSDLRRAVYQEWFDHVVLKVDPQCDIHVFGTVIHEQSLLNRLVRKKDDADRLRYNRFESRLITALDGASRSTWPERESAEDLTRQREANPYAFSQEKQNEPVDPKYCPFKAEFFTERRFWTELPNRLNISITIDPAWTIRDYSKETALVCAGWAPDGRLYVLDEHHGKYEDPSLILDLILDWYTRWAVRGPEVAPGHQFFCVGFDAISAQKLLLQMFRTRCQERQLHPVLRELKADRDKIRRIWQLEPLFRHDRIFLRPDMVYLQAQLQGFPRNTQGGLCDVADALAYHLQLGQYLPEPEPDARKASRLSFEEYAQMNESVARYRRAFPDLDPREVFGSVDGRLLAEFVRSGAP